MTRFSVNYSISFGIDVTQKEVDESREYLKKLGKPESYFDKTISAKSTDQQIATVIGMTKYRQAEAVEISDIVVETYSPEQEKKLDQRDLEMKTHEPSG